MSICRMSGCGVGYGERKRSGRGNGDCGSDGRGRWRMRVGQSSIRMWIRRGLGSPFFCFWKLLRSLSSCVVGWLGRDERLRAQADEVQSAERVLRDVLRTDRMLRAAYCVWRFALRLDLTGQLTPSVLLPASMQRLKLSINCSYVRLFVRKGPVL